MMIKMLTTTMNGGPIRSSTLGSSLHHRRRRRRRYYILPDPAFLAQVHQEEDGPHHLLRHMPMR